MTNPTHKPPGLIEYIDEFVDAIVERPRMFMDTDLDVERLVVYLLEIRGVALGQYEDVDWTESKSAAHKIQKKYNEKARKEFSEGLRRMVEKLRPKVSKEEAKQAQQKWWEGTTAKDGTIFDIWQKRAGDNPSLYDAWSAARDYFMDGRKGKNNEQR